MSWGGLNPALTAFRVAVNARFPARDTQSDGGYADAAHGSNSQHQPDDDGTVDAFDQDVNTRASTVAAGTAVELRIIEALKLDFEHDPHDRGQLWIHQAEIANRDVDDWRERDYSGDNPHDKHVHWQSRQAREHDGRPWPLPRTDALLEELTMPTTAEIVAALRPVIRAELDAKLDDIAKAVGDLPIDIETDQPGVNMQPWSRVDAYARDERAAVAQDVQELRKAVDLGFDAVLDRLPEAPPTPS